MPTLKKGTKENLKIELVELLSVGYRSTAQLSFLIQRSWGYTLSLLKELEKEKQVQQFKIGTVIAWSINSRVF